MIQMRREISEGLKRSGGERPKNPHNFIQIQSTTNTIFRIDYTGHCLLPLYRRDRILKTYIIERCTNSTPFYIHAYTVVPTFWGWGGGGGVGGEIRNFPPDGV